MGLRDFAIGRAFTNNGHSLWLCTGIGTRVVVAVRLDRAETVSVVVRGGEPGPETHAVVDPRKERSWLSGPPHFLAEDVFDEHALPASARSRSAACRIGSRAVRWTAPGCGASAA